MLFAALSGFIFVLLIPIINKYAKNSVGWIASIFPLALTVYFISFYTNVIDKGNSILESTSWVPSLGINLSFYLDGLSLTFSLIITVVGFVVFLYAGSYMKNYDSLGKFYIYIILFMSSMIGLVLSDNIITMFVFWELTSITSYLLIGFNHEKETARNSALQALLITGGGGLALLAGLIILSGISGSMSISSLASMNDILTEHRLYAPAALLILIGAFTKSAQFPFHFWLPNAMEAPTPVSAYLHSATMVKAGIYLIARMNPSLGGTELWNYTIMFVGAVTMLFTAVLSFKQTDLKKLLAYSTLSVLGTLTMLIGIGSDLAIKAFMIYLIAHALYKATLFLTAGMIDHSTGTRNIEELQGLRKVMPITAAIAILASLSKMGIIPLIGFVGKETVYAATIEYTNFGFLFITLAIAANIFVVYITMTVGFKPFFGKFRKTPKTPHELPFRMWFGPMLLAFGGLTLGIFSSFIIGKLINNTELGIITAKLNIPVKLWHGFTLELMLSFITVLLGILLFWKRNQLLKYVDNISFIDEITPSYHYQKLFNGTLKLAKLQSRILQNGFLRYYIMVIIISTIILGGTTLFSLGEMDYTGIIEMPGFEEIIIAIVMMTATYMTVRAKTRLAAIVAVGVIGYSIALIYIMYGAPDLAMTQFAIETLTLILFVLVIYRLPGYLPFSSTARRIRDFIIAGAGGLLMSLISIIILSNPLSSELKNYFAKNSYAIAKGKNIVNVILVDFRALDTMGEITVLAVAAIGVFALLKLRKGADEK